MRKSLAGAVLVLGLGATALAPIQSAAGAPVPAPTDGVYQVLGKSWGVSPADAKVRLDAEHSKASALEAAKAGTSNIDGAFFNASRQLVVNVHSAKAAEVARE